MKKERLKKMQDKRAENRRLRQNAMENKDTVPEHNKQPEQQPNVKSIETPQSSILGLENSFAFAAPCLVMKDGKLVLDTSSPELKQNNRELTLADKKSSKTTSMSFKPRNHTEKWTPEETKKFLKVFLFQGSCE